MSEGGGGREGRRERGKKGERLNRPYSPSNTQ